MATTASPAAPVLKRGVAPLRAGQGTSFLLRRLHSLTGIIPVGAFLFEHILISNCLRHQRSRRLRPAGRASWRAFRSFFFSSCSASGFRSCFTRCSASTSGSAGRATSMQYPWTGNWMYTLQRWTGGIAFVYIVWHTCTMRFTGIDLHDAASQSFGKVQAEVHNPLLFLFYVVGLVAASWHFAYGIWLFSAKWGIVTGEHAQQRLLRVCLAFFLLLSVVGLVSLYTFRMRFQQPSAEGNIVNSNHGAASLPERPVN